MSHEPVEVEIGGWLENAVCLDTGQPADGFRRNVIRREPGADLARLCRRAAAGTAARAPRPPIVLADFDGETLWRLDRRGPGLRARARAHGAVGPEQHLQGFQGKGLVNTWTGSDGPQGKLDLARHSRSTAIT